MAVGGNSGNGVLQTTWPDDIGYPPFARGARLIAMLERLRAENWDVTGSLALAVTSQPEPDEDEDDAGQ